MLCMKNICSTKLSKNDFHGTIFVVLLNKYTSMITSTKVFLIFVTCDPILLFQVGNQLLLVQWSDPLLHIPRGHDHQSDSGI